MLDVCDFPQIAAAMGVDSSALRQGGASLTGSGGPDNAVPHDRPLPSG